jgi:hypothetical protein
MIGRFVLLPNGISGDGMDACSDVRKGLDY